MVKRKNDRVYCHDVTTSFIVPEFQAVIFALFHRTIAKCHSRMWNDAMVLRYEFFVHNPIDTKENKEDAPDVALHLCLFQSW